MDNLEKEEMKIKDNISNIMMKYLKLSEKQISNIVDLSVSRQDSSQNTYRLIIQLDNNYYNCRGTNIIFQPIKFIKLLVDIIVSSDDLNYAVIFQIFCDIVNLFSIKLSRDEATVLVFIYRMINKTALDDENIYRLYTAYTFERDLSLMGKELFNSTLKKLETSNLVFIESGNYSVEDKFVIIHKKE